jgi:hypothetical protein
MEKTRRKVRPAQHQQKINFEESFLRPDGMPKID